MRIVFVSSEVKPFSKTGGLGDVAAALPTALARLGHEVIIVTPLYRCVDRERYELALTGAEVLQVPLWEKRIADGLRVVFVEHEGFFGRQGIYGDRGGDYGDNAARFAFFSMAALRVPEALGLGPIDIFHLNDWQTGLAALFLARSRGLRPGLTRSVMTIHNMGYQGIFGKHVCNELGLGWDVFTSEGIEFFDHVNFLKAGIAFADVITTVSPTYSREIQTPAHGFKLDGLLRTRGNRLFGIINGIDTNEWNPELDPSLPARYSVHDLGGKEKCRRELCRELGIEHRPDRLLIGIVSRFAEQKGFDIFFGALESLMTRNVALAVLGSGEPSVEKAFRSAAARWPSRVGLRTGFDDGLAHRIEAGADVFLMPSRYEPCGLNQMYSLRYGTVPIVRKVGGLADTVEDDGSRTPGTGFFIFEHTPEALLWACARAFDAFQERDRWLGIVRRGMAKDFSWERSARAYEAVYSMALRSG